MKENFTLFVKEVLFTKVTINKTRIVMQIFRIDVIQLLHIYAKKEAKVQRE